MERIKVNPYAFPSRFDDVKFDASDPAAKSMTIQSAADECDVNQIVERALKTGVLGDPVAMARRVASFGDFSTVGDFHSCLSRVAAAQKSFDELPLDIRVRFNNDPGLLIAFLADPANAKEAVKLGLLPKEVIAEQLAAEAAAEAEAAALAAKQKADAEAAAKAAAAANSQAGA